VSVFRPGSTSPSAILFDAWENFHKRSPKADENIRSIKPDLAAAVDEVIDAAAQEWEPAWQRRLLSVRLLVLTRSLQFGNFNHHRPQTSESRS
jgi:vacuolar protein sorting-associated protein 16